MFLNYSILWVISSSLAKSNGFEAVIQILLILDKDLNLYKVGA